MNPISPCWWAWLSQNRVQSPTSWPVSASSAARQSALPSAGGRWPRSSLQQDAHLGPVPWLVIQVAGDLGQPVVVMQGVKVIRRERPEHQPRRADGVVGLEHGCCPSSRRAPGRGPAGLWRSGVIAAAGGGPRGRRDRPRPRAMTGTGRAQGRSSQRSAPRLRTRCSAASIPAATASARSEPADRDLRRHQQALRAHVEGPQVDHPLTSSPASSAATIARSASALADSPMSRLFVSTARIVATTASSAPIASDPAPSTPRCR